MWASIMPLGERREESRRPSHVHARLRTTDVRPVNQFEALIEERGRRGVRLTSNAPLLTDAVVVVHPSGERRPLHARVVWARRLESRPSPTWRAGCRLLGLEAEPTARAVDPALVREPDAVAVRTVVAAGLIGVLVLFVYAILSFAKLVGEAAAINP
jgi:hypothetical protein